MTCNVLYLYSLHRLSSQDIRNFFGAKTHKKSDGGKESTVKKTEESKSKGTAKKKESVKSSSQSNGTKRKAAQDSSLKKQSQKNSNGQKETEKKKIYVLDSDSESELYTSPPTVKGKPSKDENKTNSTKKAGKSQPRESSNDKVNRKKGKGKSQPHESSDDEVQQKKGKRKRQQVSATTLSKK